MDVVEDSKMPVGDDVCDDWTEDVAESLLDGISSVSGADLGNAISLFDDEAADSSDIVLVSCGMVSFWGLVGTGDCTLAVLRVI